MAFILYGSRNFTYRYIFSGISGRNWHSDHHMLQSLYGNGQKENRHYVSKCDLILIYVPEKIRFYTQNRAYSKTILKMIIKCLTQMHIF